MNDKAEPVKDFMVTALLDSTSLKREQLSKIIDACTDFRANDSCANAYQVFYLSIVLVLKITSKTFCSFWNASQLTRTSSQTKSKFSRNYKMTAQKFGFINLGNKI